MESKIPLPTDNIYKFYALFGLFVFVFSIGALLYVNQVNNARVLSLYPELAELTHTKNISPPEETKRAILERLIEVQASDQKLYKNVLNGLAGISFWCMGFGFWRWHRVVQPRIDEANLVQLELAKLHLAKLRAEMAFVPDAEASVQAKITRVQQATS